jgi:deoxyribose-phosphate aldolase
MMPSSKEELAKLIDHTLLKPNITLTNLESFLRDAKKYNFRAVCIPPYWVKFSKNFLKDTNIKIATVVGFPLGYTTLEAKISEIREYIRMGVDELDIVMNITAFKSGDYDYIKDEFDAIINESKGKLVKIIIGTDYLSDDEIVKATELAMKAGIPVIKTNTGFGIRGATLKDVEIIKKVVGNRALIKAAGGIRTAKQALKFIKMGANIIGTSSGVKIVDEFDVSLLEII